MRMKTLSVQIKDQPFSRRKPISVITILTKLKKACNSLRIHNEGAVWIIGVLLSGHTLFAIDKWLNLPSKDSEKHKCTITSYAVVLDQLLRQYGTDAVIGKAHEDIQNLERWSLSQ